MHDYQKTISLLEYPRQTGLIYCQEQDRWVTTEPDGNINIWDLEQERIERTIKCKNAGPIVNVIEIPTLGLLALNQDLRAAGC